MTPFPHPAGSRPRSRRIGEAFGKARAYDANATPQLASAAHLAELILRTGFPDGARVLDMGCGTGGLAACLLPQGSINGYLCADIAPPMLGRARTKLACSSPSPLFAAMDAQRPALKPGFHLVASNMALHWVEDLRAALAALWELVLPGGLLAVAIPGSETFRAWREAHERLGLPCGLQDFPTAEALAGMFPVRPDLSEKHHPLPLARPMELPLHLKAVGGRVPREGHHPLTPGQFRAVLTEVARHTGVSPDALPLGYSVLYALAAKPADDPLS